MLDWAKGRYDPPMEFEKLVQLPESARDDRWEKQFLDSILTLKVRVLEDGQTATGPDGWPYLKVATQDGEESFDKVVRWLAGRGIGLVVNPHKMVPDYVFTYGMLWNFVETGFFVSPWSPPPAGQVLITPESRPVVGPPTDKFLPPYVRDILRELLQAQGFDQVKILVAASQDFTEQDLVVANESVGELNASEQRQLAEALSWFLPLHYSLVFGPEQNLRGWVSL